MTRRAADDIRRDEDIERLSATFVQAHNPITGQWTLLDRATGRIVMFDSAPWPGVQVKA